MRIYFDAEPVPYVESPVRDYADEFILFDADGPGQLIGFIHSIENICRVWYSQYVFAATRRISV